jgi:hypothetical protein
MKSRWPLLILFIFALSMKSHADDSGLDDVIDQETTDEFKGMDGGTFTGEAPPEEEPPNPAAAKASQKDLEKAEKADLEPKEEAEDKGTEFKSVHKLEIDENESEDKPAEKSSAKPSHEAKVKPEPVEDRQKLLDKTDSDCFAFDNPGKYSNSVTMMKNCTKAFKKVRNREGLKWAMIYFDRNFDSIEDTKCMKRGPAQRGASKKGIQNKCEMLFMDSSGLCKNGKFKRNRYIEAKFIDLCADKGLALYPVKVKAGSLTCKYLFSDENKDSTPVGAFLSKGKNAKSKAKPGELVAYGLNESNYMADHLPTLSEKKIMDKLNKKQTLIVNVGPAKYHLDPSLCMNGRPASSKPSKSVDVRAPASKNKVKAHKSKAKTHKK